MPITFVGKYPEREWIPTGLHSFDIAVGNPERGNIGIPTRVGVHIFGPTKIGKTTSVLSLAGILANKLEAGIAISPIDTFDIRAAESILEFAELQYPVNIVLAGPTKKDTEAGIYIDEKTAKQLSVEFAKDDWGVGIWDSIGAISPISEQEGDPGDANMGRRAKLVSTLARQLKPSMFFSKYHKIFFAINHEYPKLGAMARGSEPPGGNAIRYLTSVHIRLSQPYLKSKPIRFTCGKLIEGMVVEHNFAPAKRKFNWFVMGNVGIHPGITAAFDCVSMGLAEFSISTNVDNSKFTLDGTKYSIAEMCENFRDKDMFAPFHSAIEQAHDDIIQDAIANTEEDGIELDSEEIMEEG